MDIDNILSEYKVQKTENEELEKTLSDIKEGLTHPPDRATRKILETKKKEYEELKNESDKKIRGVLHSYLSNIIITPGDEKRFEQLTGIQVEIVKLENRNKGMTIPADIPEHYINKDRWGVIEQLKAPLLLENRVIGLIEAQCSSTYANNDSFSITGSSYYGLPVRKIEQKQGE